ncbi:MAG: bifunctional UDP-sugar hydrolase/5'-nucleotidase [Pseudomonadota bacterium]
MRAMRCFGASTLVLALSIGAAAAEPVTLKIVHFNDLDRMEEDGGKGGVARLAAVVEEIRANHPNVLVTNGGDSISPSLLSGFDQGAHMIDLFNQVGIDAMAVGNHEFDFGPDTLVERIAEAQFPMLSNNALEADGSLVDGVTESLMLDVGDYKVGMFGLTTASTAVKSSPGPITFGDPVETAKAVAMQLREDGADLVVALTHTDRGEDDALIRAAPVDLVLSGDDHDLRLDYDGEMALIESGSQAEFVTVVTITMDTVEGRRGPSFVWEPSFEMINTAAVEPSTKVAAAVQGYADQLSAELDIDIGTTDVELDSRRSTVRSKESAFANLMVDAMRSAVGADVGLTNGGGIRADRTYEPGTVLTRRDIQSELPFGNKTILIEVSGADLRAALENGVSEVEDQGGRFPHVSGVTFRYDASKPAGARVVDVMVGDAPLDDAAQLKLATNDFMGGGGDGYDMFVGRPRIIDANAGSLMAGQVIEHIEGAGTIAPEVEGRITRLD